MKVEVVQSLTLSRIHAGMKGEANCTLATWQHSPPNTKIEVQFENVPSSVPGDNRRGFVIVLMDKQELKPI